jgi:hypothetical protein
MPSGDPTLALAHILPLILAGLLLCLLLGLLLGLLAGFGTSLVDGLLGHGGAC